VVGYAITSRDRRDIVTRWESRAREVEVKLGNSRTGDWILLHPRTRAQAFIHEWEATGRNRIDAWIDGGHSDGTKAAMIQGGRGRGRGRVRKRECERD